MKHEHRTFLVYSTCECELNVVHGFVGGNFNLFAEMQSVLFLNKDIQQSARLMKGVLSGKQATQECQPELRMICYELTFVKYAQIAPCDGHFPHYKSIISDNHG